MSGKFTPDDAIIQGDTGRERIDKALKDHREKYPDQPPTITSRDPGMNDLLDALRRDDKDMPADFVQWQLPVHLDGPALFFLTVVPPGGIVTMHAHDRDMFRVVVSGSIILHDGRELKSGDWMFVPNDEEYSFRAGLNPGAIIYHCYG